MDNYDVYENSYDDAGDDNAYNQVDIYDKIDDLYDVQAIIMMMLVLLLLMLIL